MIPDPSLAPIKLLNGNYPMTQLGSISATMGRTP